MVLLILKNYSNEEALPDMWIFRPTMKLLYVISHTRFSSQNIIGVKKKEKSTCESAKDVWDCRCHCS